MDRMTASPTSTDEGPACAAMGGGDLFRHKADERKFFAGDKSLTVEEVLELRWLEMEAANQREKAELRERLGLLPEDIDPNLGFSDPPLTAEEIRAQAEKRPIGKKIIWERGCRGRGCRLLVL